MGYHTDHIQQLEDEIDALKTDLAHEVNTLTAQRDEYKEILGVYKHDLSKAFDMIEKLEDASDYWKETFEDFYNAILRITEQNEDLELTNKLIDKLLAYEGESDGQRQNKF